MNLNHLRVFVAVAEEGSITAAADKLSISQPAVSKQLADFENALGANLVDRHPRGVKLTSAGELLLTHARRIFQTEQAAEAELDRLLGLTEGRLSVGASTTIGNYLVPELFGRFKRGHPEVNLQLQIANTAVIQAAVREDRFDLGLTEGFADAEGLDVEVFAHDEMVMIRAPKAKFVRGRSIHAAALADMPVLVREPGSGTRDVITAALAERGIEIEPAMSLGSTEALKQAVAAGLGVAIVSKLAVELEVQARILTVVEIDDLVIRRPLHLLTLRGKTPSPASRTFIELLRENHG